jgi:hypothetical protein
MRDIAPAPIDAETLAARLRAAGHRIFADTWTDPPGAAECLGVKVDTLQRWRSAQRGPRFSQPGKIVFYALEDLIAYLFSGPDRT